MIRKEWGTWQTAAHLFARALVQICPKTVFVKIGVDPLGFFCDYLTPDPLTRDHLDHILRSVQQFIGSSPPVEVVEMVSSNVTDYLKHLKQPIRANSIDRSKKWTTVIRLNYDYADQVEGPAESDLSKIGVIEVDLPQQIGEHVYHKQRHPLYRIYGYAFPTRQEAKAHKKCVQQGKLLDHRQYPFAGEVVVLWRDIYQKAAECLRNLGYQEVWRNDPLKKGEFSEQDVAIDNEMEFGLKAHGHFRGIGFFPMHPNDWLINHLENALLLNDLNDAYGVKWSLVEVEEEGKIWIDRIVALLLEQKTCQKRPFPV